jgi:aryl-alcohol dehydrogenase-like predicted oxidoreductase
MWGMGGWTGSDDDESLGSLHRAIELGCTFFDTAWVYGQGRSEKLLGQTIRSHPGARIIVATKIPPKNMRWPARRLHDPRHIHPSTSANTPRRASRTSAST